MSQTLTITDPRRDTTPIPSLFREWVLGLIRDERDWPFIRLMVSIGTVLLPFAVLLYVPGVFRWWLGAAYLALNFAVFFDRFILMLHNTSHRPLFRKRFRRLNAILPWVLGPLFGQTPDTYFAHHIGMHHPEENLPDDLSCTMAYRRDSMASFLAYWSRFFAFGAIELPMYFARRRRWKLMRMTVVGEGLALAAYAALLFVNWQATLVVFVIPLVLARFLMMAGNWAQHAFVDPTEPDNPYKSSIVCVNTRYNRRCFNDGYHIGHHEKPSRHWTEMPGDFEAKRDRYAREEAVVFDGIDYFQIWALLMVRAYGVLAKHFVDLSEHSRSREEIIALLRSRTLPIPV